MNEYIRDKMEKFMSSGGHERSLDEAILRERERCAKIAKEEWKTHTMPRIQGYEIGAEWASLIIEKKILEGK